MSALDPLLREARTGPWHAEPDLMEDGDRHSAYPHGPGVWLANDHGDSLLVSPDDVAALLNHALADPPLAGEELDHRG